MAENSKLRMNLVAIKKVDPYARDIVDSSSHVAFYTFNGNEWEKTDVEGAFFIYSRNAAPYHSIFIINRLNTSSFVEPITTQLELQSQPPFLLYRNERSRIRGFWFYNSDECDRISSLVCTLVEKSGDQSVNEPVSNTHNSINPKQDNVNLFKMLSDAQKEFSNNSTNVHHIPQTGQNTNMAAAAQITAAAPSNKVLEFFASAKPTTVDTKLLMANTLSVEQIEKQQRTKTNEDDRAKHFPAVSQFFDCPKMSGSPTNITTKSNDSSDLPNELAKFLNSVDIKNNRHESNNVRSNPGDVTQTFRNLLCAEVNLQTIRNVQQETTKPALMPPTMFEKSIGGTFINNANRPQSRQEPLNTAQFVEAFNYLMQNDDEFVNKLHAAYLQVFSKTTIVGTYQ